MLRAARTPVPLPLPRYVYSYVGQPSGETFYYAVTSDGTILNGELRRRLPDECEEQILRDMWRDLNRQDPVPTRPQLALYVNGVRQP